MASAKKEIYLLLLVMPEEMKKLQNFCHRKLPSVYFLLATKKALRHFSQHRHLPFSVRANPFKEGHLPFVDADLLEFSLFVAR